MLNKSKDWHLNVQVSSFQPEFQSPPAPYLYTTIIYSTAMEMTLLSTSARTSHYERLPESVIRKKLQDNAALKGELLMKFILKRCDSWKTKSYDIFF